MLRLRRPDHQDEAVRFGHFQCGRPCRRAGAVPVGAPRIPHQWACLRATEPACSGTWRKWSPRRFTWRNRIWCCSNSATATDQTEIQRLKREFADFEKLSRSAKHTGPRIFTKDRLKQALTKDVWPSAREFFRVAKTEFLPAGRQGRMASLAQVLEEKFIRVSWSSGRPSSGRCKTAKEATAREEADVGQRVGFWLTTMIVLSILSVVVILVAGGAGGPANPPADRQRSSSASRRWPAGPAT